MRAERPAGSKSPFEFDAYTLNHAAHVGITEVAWVQDFEDHLTERKVFVKKGSSSFSHFAFFKTTPKAMKLSMGAMFAVVGSQDLGDQFSLTSDQAGFGLNDFSFTDTMIGERKIRQTITLLICCF